MGLSCTHFPNNDFKSLSISSSTYHLTGVWPSGSFFLSHAVDDGSLVWGEFCCTMDHSTTLHYGIWRKVVGWPDVSTADFFPVDPIYIQVLASRKSVPPLYCPYLILCPHSKFMLQSRSVTFISRHRFFLRRSVAFREMRTIELFTLISTSCKWRDIISRQVRKSSSDKVLLSLVTFQAVCDQESFARVDHVLS